MPSEKNAAGQWSVWPKAEYEYERLCSIDGSGAFTCDAGQTCGTPVKYEISLIDDDVPNDGLIMYGIINYDNIISGMVTIF